MLSRNLGGINDDGVTFYNFPKFFNHSSKYSAAVVENKKVFCDCSVSGLVPSFVPDLELQLTLIISTFIVEFTRSIRWPTGTWAFHCQDSRKWKWIVTFLVLSQLLEPYSLLEMKMLQSQAPAERELLVRHLTLDIGHWKNDELHYSFHNIIKNIISILRNSSF